MAQGIWSQLKQTFAEFRKDDAPRHGAALAFYTAVSLSPLVLMVIGIVSWAYGEDAARGELIVQVKSYAGEDAGKVIEGLLANPKAKESGILSTVIGLVGLIAGASGVFASLQDSINHMWNFKEDEGGGVWQMVKDRFLSFATVCGVAFLLIVSLVVSAGLTAVGKQLPFGGVGLQVLNAVLSYAVITALFALIFKLLPKKRPAWKDVWVGAAITAVLFTLGKFLIGLYLGTAGVGSAYGAAGSFVVLLVWIYYSSQILLFGAEFTQVYAAAHGRSLPDTEPVAAPVAQPTPA